MDTDKIKLSIYYQNVRGLRTKTNIFYINFSTYSYDIVLVTETWLCDSVLDYELCCGSHDVFRRDRGSLGAGGGVMALCAARLGARARPEPEWQVPGLECVWLTVPASALASRNNLHIAVVYIPPNRDIPIRVEQLIRISNQVISENPTDHILVAGDFNLPCLKWVNSEPICLKQGSVDIQNAASNLVQQMSYHSLTQYNYTNNSLNRTLDLVFSNFSLEITNTELPLVKEDRHHPSLLINASDLMSQELKPLPRTRFQYHKANYELLNEYFLSCDWSELVNISDVEDLLTCFYHHLHTAIRQFVPKVRASGTYNYPVWYSRSLIMMIREKSLNHATGNDTVIQLIM